MDSDEKRTTSGGHRPARRSWVLEERAARRRKFAVLCLVLVVAGGFLAGGFVRFTETTAASARSDAPVRADAIVVLTGGALRIQQAVDLLQQGHGDRLLISGVNRETSKSAIARLTDTDRDLFDCCVDVDFAAADTEGNAAQAVRWARERGYEEIILVTSDYHMQRSLVEFERAGGIETIHPVAVRRDDLWQDGAIPTASGLKVLLTEYAKLMAARVRATLLGVDPSITRAVASERL